MTLNLELAMDLLYGALYTAMDGKQVYMTAPRQYFQTSIVIQVTLRVLHVKKVILINIS